MFHQYLKFVINGGILGLISWLLQIRMYQALGGNSGETYALAAALTYVPLIVINFLVQRAWIFKRDGLFVKFLTANLAIMLLVTLLSPLCRSLIASMAGVHWGDRFGFLIAALLGSVPSFLIKKRWVFIRPANLK